MFREKDKEMNIVSEIKEKSAQALEELYQLAVPVNEVLINETKPEFEGDYTLVLFSFIKQIKKAPEVIGNEIGKYLKDKYPAIFTSYNVIKGFLNLEIADSYFINFLDEDRHQQPTGRKIMVEYSSPNTNKPLHLGHLRNNFLGWSIAKIAEANGNEVIKTCVVNDRGIHICKSMVAWQRFAKGATPQSTAQKGDHFVGDYYVKFNDAYKQEINELIAHGMSEAEAEKEAPIMKEAQQMLINWEAGKPEVISLWKEMNGWVYKGFDKTYEAIGSKFDKIYYESEIYLLGKNLVEDGLQKGVFFQKEDGSVWIDLTSEGLDEKLVQRKDGTSVYITQDIALAVLKQQEYGIDKNIYVVGDEQNYHFKVLKLICQKLGLASADGIYHLSYGMVELPTGKMKSREGTVVDADDLVEEMISIARNKTEELGKVKDFTGEELENLYATIGLGALKFFLLRVDPKKKMIFNPEESIDFHGFTGPFIQYTHARIKSILRKIAESDFTFSHIENYALNSYEKDVLLHLEQYSAVCLEAFELYDPSKIAIYIFELAKKFNAFYTECSIANAEKQDEKSLRVKLARQTAETIRHGMSLLGIQVPERM